MALKIRLARGGTKKRPYYRIVIADARSPRDGRFIEKVGHYNPLLAKDAEGRSSLEVDKIKDWLTKGAQPTDRVARILSEAGLIEWKHGNNPKQGTPGQKATERLQEKKDKEADRLQAEADAKEAAAEAKAAGDAAAKAASEAPAEEAASE